MGSDRVLEKVLGRGNQFLSCLSSLRSLAKFSRVMVCLLFMKSLFVMICSGGSHFWLVGSGTVASGRAAVQLCRFSRVRSASISYLFVRAAVGQQVPAERRAALWSSCQSREEIGSLQYGRCGG